MGLTYRTIRDRWLAEGREFDVPARLWKETLRDTLVDVTAYREAAKVEVRRAMQRRIEGEEEPEAAERKRSRVRGSQGYSEVFIDSDGQRHGEGSGQLPGAESDTLKVKYQRRNKLEAIAEAKPHKREAVYRNNLGRWKLDRCKHTARVRDRAFKATHSVACEDLTAPISGRPYYKDQKRRLAAWVKGLMAEPIPAVSQPRFYACSRECSLHLANGSRYGVLLDGGVGAHFTVSTGRCCRLTRTLLRAS